MASLHMEYHYQAKQKAVATCVPTVQEIQEKVIAPLAGADKVDYTSEVETDPDWSGNNGGVWWENAFDDGAAAWSDGELGVGYDTTNGTWEA